MTIRSGLCDKVLVVIHCPEKDSVVLSQISQGWYIPHEDIKNNSWQSSAESLHLSITKIQPPKTLRLKTIYRVWKKDNEPPLHSVIFYSQVKPEALSGVSNPYTIVDWNDFSASPSGQQLHPETLNIVNNTTKEQETALVEVMKDGLIVYPDTPGKLETLIKSVDISEEDQIELYELFLSYTYPYLKMDQASMSAFMNDINLLPFEKEHFKSADVANRGCVDFKQLLGFIAAVQTTSIPRDGVSADQRCRYVFRYYDRDNDDRLSVDEFSKLIDDVSSLKPNLNDKQELMESFKSDFINVTEFAKLVGSLKLRGTSSLMVAPKSIQSVLSQRRAERTGFRNASYASSSSLKISKRKKSYSLAGHFVTLPSQSEHVSSITNTRLSFSSEPSSHYGEGNIDITTSSVENFDADTPDTYVLNALNYFADSIFDASDEQSNPNWWDQQYPEFYRNLILCCVKAKVHLEREPRLLRIPSPAYIVGDIHGKFHDIMSLRKWFWSTGLEHALGSVVFLGDYVDRGKHSVEVIAYLIAQKAKNHSKLFLLRGNHETRKVQKDCTFYSECMTKFETRGATIWESINDVFDRLPLAALIDGQVFCCHGGIPMPSLCPSLEVIDRITCPLPDPNSNKLAWALLWNDPQRVGYNYNSGKKVVEGGFAKNTKRKTGHTFDSNALQWFIDKHNLSYVVRAHEIQDGFHVELNNKLITVFSSSNYRGNNRSGCVLVQQNKLRVFTINSTPAKNTEPHKDVSGSQ